MQSDASFIDIKNNPFYCPAITAHNFISALRRRREAFRSKEHIYRGKRISLKPFAAALDECLLTGGGDNDGDKRTTRLQHESGTDSSDDEPNNTFEGPFNAHTSTLNAAARSFASIKHSLLRTALRRNTGDSNGSDSFVTVPLAPTAKKDTSSEFATLSDRSGRPLVTTRRNCSFAPHTLRIWDKLSLKRSSRAEPSASLKRKSSESGFTDGSRTKRARSTLSVNESSFYLTIPREKLQFARTPSTSPLILSSTSFEFSERNPAVDHSSDELRAGMHMTVPRLKNWNGPLESMRDLNHDDLLELAGALQGPKFIAYIYFSDLSVDELFGQALAPETNTQALVEKLNSMFSGIRIKERLTEWLKSGSSHQSIINFFAENGEIRNPSDCLENNNIPLGLLNANVLELFRASQVTKISLSESFKDVNGLNLVSDDSFFGTSSIPPL